MSADITESYILHQQQWRSEGGVGVSNPPSPEILKISVESSIA